MNMHSDGCGEALSSDISSHSLHLLKQDGLRPYIWQHHSNNSDESVALIDLNGICLPENEINELLLRLEKPCGSVHSIAFLNCNLHNQREIKRKLKALNVKLFSNSAFFSDISEAERWLTLQMASY